MDSNNVTRRTVIGMLAASTGVGTIANALPLLSFPPASHAGGLTTGQAPQEVVSFFMDLPYIDKTGTAVPYIPARGYARNYDSLPHYC